MNIQPNDHNNSTFEISTAAIPRLIVSDRRLGDQTEQVARDMRIIAAPKHPGRDPVSTYLLEQFVSVLRGDGGLAPRMADITGRLRGSADRLDATLTQTQATDHESARTFRRVDDGPRP